MRDPATRARQSQALRDAARAKRDAATARAEKGIRALIKSGEAIDFRSVARTSGVSINFLYTHKSVRARIESLRAQQREATRPAPEPPEGDTAIVRVLTAKLKDERRRHREEITALRTELAATHGALLQHRRRGGIDN